MSGTELELLANYGWIAISLVLAGVVVYLYKQQRKDHTDLTGLYEKWIKSNNESGERIDKLIGDYGNLLVKMSTVMQQVMDKFDLEEKNNEHK